MTAEDHHHQTDPTKKITREQEGKEGYVWSLVYLGLCVSMHVSFCVCAYVPGLKLRKNECLKFITICVYM